MLANALGLPPLASGLIATGFLTVLTGALHEDGLADTADGFRRRPHPLSRTARDHARQPHRQLWRAGARPRHHAEGENLLAAFLQWRRISAALALVAVEAIGRAAIVQHWVRQPPARPDGLGGRASGQPGEDTLAWRWSRRSVIGAVAATLARRGRSPPS